MFPLARVLQRAGNLYPNKIAVVDGESQLTYRELTLRVHRLAGILTQLGLRRGDRVAVLDFNSQRYLELYYACAHAGFVFLPINSRLAARELQYVVNDSGCRALILSDAFIAIYEDIQRNTSSIEIVISTGRERSPPGVLLYEDLLDSATPLVEPVATELDETALIFYTSGTTGEPKGVCLSNASMFAGAVDGIIACNITMQDNWLHAGPLFHLATCFAVWSAPLMGATQSVMHFDTKRLVEVIGRQNITMTCLPGAILGMVAEELTNSKTDLSALRTVMYGGSPTPLGVLNKAGRVFPAALTHAYGATETSGFISVLRPSEHIFAGSHDELSRTVSAGQPTPMMEVRVVDDNGNDVAVGAIGEIICGGPKIMSGYWNKVDATAAVLRDGWYHTGDLGTLSNDHFLTVVDRKKDMIISGGENVYSLEVENVLSTHPSVAEVAVIGVPDQRWGEAVMAILVARGPAPSVEELVTFCRGKIAGYKIPRLFEIRTEPLPKSGPGKIAKRTLRDPYWKSAGRSI